MMWIVLWYMALVHPKKTMMRISCQHPDRRDHMIDAGMDKMWTCGECGAAGFFRTGAAA